MVEPARAEGDVFLKASPMLAEVPQEEMAGLPQIPKLGDMGAAGYLAGLFLSLVFGAASFARGKSYRSKAGDGER